MISIKSIKTLLFCFLLLTKLSVFGQPMNIPEKDSTDTHIQKTSRLNVAGLLFNGVLIHNEEKRQSWYIHSFFDLFQYNTLEGYVLNPAYSFTKHLNGKRFFTIKPNLRYGLDSNKPYGQFSTLYYYNPKKLASIEVNGGKFIRQIDKESTLSNFANTYSTLLFDENLLKAYESKFVEFKHVFSPKKDILLTTNLFWDDRNPLQNLEKFDKEHDKFTSNLPQNVELENTNFDGHRTFYIEHQLRWQPDLKYTYERGKFISTSRYPSATLTYQSAHSGLLGSDLSYQKISLSLDGTLKSSTLGQGEYLVEIGDFISKDSLTFIDFNHFQGNRVSFSTFNAGAFELLDYYENSTIEFYLQGHYMHTFNNILSRLERLLIVDASYLLSQNNHYFELGLGIQKAKKPWRFSFYSSWSGGSHDRAEIRLGYML